MKILVADDHDVVRAGIRSVVAETDIEIVGEAIDGDQAVEMTLENRPDLLILDVRMPRCDGLKALGKIKLERPEQPVLMFSSHDNPTYVARAVALGANGYLLKSCTAAEFVEAVQRTGRGETIWTREELRRVTGALATPRMSTDIEVPLTQRESEVLKHLSLGLTNKEIAQALDISYETVKEHVQHILRKVGVADRTQAAVWAVRKGLI
jgi:DNA-binding NarL/FixJ family response regulator